MRGLTLDLMVSRAVYRAKVMERMLHDRGPWSVLLGDREIPVEPTITDAGVVFSFVVGAEQSAQGMDMVLLCDGEPLWHHWLTGVAPNPDPEAETVLDWTFTADLAEV